MIITILITFISLIGLIILPELNHFILARKFSRSASGSTASALNNYIYSFPAVPISRQTLKVINLIPNNSRVWLRNAPPQQPCFTKCF